MITVSVVHSCFILYEKLFLQVIKSLETSEGRRTDIRINLQPLIGDVPYESVVYVQYTFTGRVSGGTRGAVAAGQALQLMNTTNKCYILTDLHFTFI